MEIISNFGVLNSIALFAYLACVVVVGFVFSGRQKSGEDFFLAGRTMPWLPVAMSMYASVTSASTYLALPGKSYSENISMIVAGITSPLAAPLLAKFFYPAYRKAGVTTSYEFIGIRFGGHARLTTSVLFVLARLGWLGIVLYAPSIALSVTTGWHVGTCICIFGVIATLYTVMGGLAAVVWTDVLQFIVLVSGAIFVLVTLAVCVPGGFAHIFEVAAQNGKFSIMGGNPAESNTGAFFTRMTIWSVALHMMLTMCQEYGADQVTVQRLISVKDDRGVTKAVIFNAATDFVMVSVLLLIGLGLYAFFGQETLSRPLPAGMSGDYILPFYVRWYLPDGIAGLVVTAILAAAMSSADSGMNSIAAVLETDIFPVFRKRQISEQRKIVYARATTIVLGAVSICSAFLMSRLEDLLDGFSFVISLFNAPVFALFILGFAWKRATFTGWAAALLPTLCATWFIKTHTDVNWSWRYAFSFVTSLILSMIFSYAANFRRRNRT